MTRLKRLQVTATAFMLSFAAAQGAPTVTPTLNITLLPYGTIVLADGAYYIPDFFGTGVAIYLQSAKPIRIATLEETVQLKRQWAATPESGKKSAAALAQAAQQAGFPSDEDIWSGTWKGSSASKPAGTTAVAVNVNPLKQTQTPLPDYMKVQFRSTPQGLTYRINNTSSAEDVRIDPANMRVYHNGQPLSAAVTARDSSSGKATGVLKARSALIGTIQVQNIGTGPLTLAWVAYDSAGKAIPISFQWTPGQP